VTKVGLDPLSLSSILSPDHGLARVVEKSRVVTGKVLSRQINASLPT
jgi:hypothetical protein